MFKKPIFCGFLVLTLISLSLVGLQQALANGKTPLSTCLNLTAKGDPIRFQMEANPNAGFKGFDVTLQPISHADFKTDEELEDAFQPGKGTALFGLELVGLNIAMGTHSGWHDGKSLNPGNLLRDWIEGSRLNKAEKKFYRYDTSTVERQIKAIVGLTMTITQGDCTVKVKLESIAYITNKYVKEFNYDLQSILQVVLDSQDGEVRESFKQTISDDQQHLFMFFCGWGSNLSYSNWGTWTRYVLNFAPISPDK